MPAFSVEAVDVPEDKPEEPRELRVGDRGPYGKIWDGEHWQKPARAPADADQDQEPTRGELVTILKEALAPLEARIAAAEERQQPTFRPMDTAMTNTGPGNVRDIFATLESNQAREGDNIVPHSSSGAPLLPHVLNRYPKLRVGLFVTINRTLVRAHNGGRSWGDIFGAQGTVRCTTTNCTQSVPVGDHCPVCGEGPKIIGVHYLDEHDGQWRYQVRVPGHTSPSGMIFYGAELTPLR